MRLDWLELRDFRCYRKVELRLDPGLDLFVGLNGAGKTSLLEAVGYLGALRSFRGSPDGALVRHGASGAVLRGGFVDTVGEHRVEITLGGEGRRVLFDGKRLGRQRDLLTLVGVVWFHPDDLDLVKRGPDRRRVYLDDLAARLWPSAVAAQQEFERALRQRNALLRREGRHADALTLDVWDRRLAEGGAGVVSHRLRLVDVLRPLLRATYAEVGEGGDLAVRYRASWGGGDVETLLNALATARDRDLEQRTTTVGPHRDEVVFLLDGRPVRTAASQGEQRTVALALRLAAHRVLTDVRGEPPVLLLDDVFSELDAGRVERIVAGLPEGQVLVTTARADVLPGVARTWNVEGGTVR